MKFIVLLFSVFSFHNLQACEIELYHNYIFTKAPKNLKNETLFRKSSCKEDTTKEILMHLYNSQGAIDSKRIKEYLFPSKEIKIIPDRISIHNLDNKLKNETNLRESYRFKVTNEMSHKYNLGFDNEDSIEFLCNNCHRTGKSHLRVIVTNSRGSKTTLWFKGEVLAGIKALIAKRDIPPHQKIKPENDFKTQIYYTSSPQNYQINQDEIRFSKLARTALRGSPIKRNQVLPINIIKAGSLVKTKLKYNSINLSGKMMAMSSGKFNDIIKLRHQGNGRIIQGKVIDYNLVEVEP